MQSPYYQIAISAGGNVNMAYFSAYYNQKDWTSKNASISVSKVGSGFLYDITVPFSDLENLKIADSIVMQFIRNYHGQSYAEDAKYLQMFPNFKKDNSPEEVGSNHFKPAWGELFWAPNQ